MRLMNKFFNQTRKPEGFLGKVMLSGMNGGGHAKLANFGMDKLPKKDFINIAELGCGAGRNISELLRRYPNAFVSGVDYSELSVEKSREFNKKNSNRCEINQGDVFNLELENNHYDLATAFETIYFWPGLEKCFKNVANVLKEGGYFLIVNESNGEDETGKKFESIIEGMKVYTASEIVDALKSAGFKNISTFNDNKKPWLAIIAEK